MATAAPSLEDLPLIEYQAIEDEYKAKGIDLYDMMGSFKNGVQDDPDVPYVNFWHTLISLTDFVPWNETSSERSKEVPVGPAMVKVPEDPTAKELSDARKRLEAKNGPLEDSVWYDVSVGMRERKIRAQKALEVLTDISERYGVTVPSIPTLGKLFRVRMSVSR